VENGLGRSNACFEILGESPVPIDPSEETLHYPAPGMDSAADLTWVLAHDLDSNNGRAYHPVRRLGAIGKDTLYQREQLARGLK
jgi:hypothetical protein